MSNSHDETQSSGINFWPPVLDMLAATLMVFVLVTYAQRVLTADLKSALLRERKNTFITQFSDSLRSEIRNQLIAIEPQTNNDVLIRFNNEVLFPSGAYHLKPSGERILRRVGYELQSWTRNCISNIQVEGHTDSDPVKITRGSPEDVKASNNWELSSLRATSVVDFLAHTSRIQQQYFSANGYAHFKPIDDSNTAAAKQLNRRVEIRLFFDLSDDIDVIDSACQVNR